MGLIKPVLYQVPAFDALKSYTFEFNVPSGGDRVEGNRLVIRNQINNEIVYNEVETTLNWRHTVEGGTLKNGEYYNAYVATIKGQEESLPSNTIQFRCIKTPIITFDNLPESKIIESSKFDFQFTYSFGEEVGITERLDNYIVKLYNSNQTLISSSDIIYVKEGEGTPPYNFSYSFAGFEDDAFYFIEVVGVTINNLRFSSERVEFNVNYSNPSIFAILGLENNCEEGYIKVSSNVKIIDGEYSPVPPKFIDNKEIDLTGKTDFIQWTNGYKIDGDFLARIWFRGPNENSNILSFRNSKGQTIQVDYMVGYENVNAPEKKAYIQVSVDYGIFSSTLEIIPSYYIYSNYVDILPDTEYYNLQLERIGEIYKVELLKIGE